MTETTKFAPALPQVIDRNYQPVQLDDYDSLGDKFISGQVGFVPNSKIPMVDPQGEPVFIQPQHFKVALDQGYKIDTPEAQTNKWLQENYGSGAQTAQAGLESVARGLSIGLSDVAAKGLGADTEAMRLRKEANPKTAIAGEVGGIIAPTIFTGGEALLAKAGVAGAEKGTAAALAKLTPIELAMQGGKAVEGAVANAVGKTEAATLANKIIQKGFPKMAGSAVEGAIYGTGNTLSEDALGEHDLTAEHLLANVGINAALGGGLGAGVAGIEASKPLAQAAIDKAKKATGEAAKKSITSLFGVPEEVLNKYVSYKEKGIDLSTLPSRAELAEDVAEKVGGAKAKVKELESDLKFDLMPRARQEAYESEKQAAEMLRGKLRDNAEEFASHLEAYKGEAVNLSKAVQLELQGMEIKKSNDLISELSSREQKWRDKGLDNVADEIGKIRTDIENKIAEGTADQKFLKDRIMGLDDQINWGDQGRKPFNNAYMDARVTIDRHLKDINPEYAKVMKDISQRFENISDLRSYMNPEIGYNKFLKFDKDASRELAFDVPKIKNMEKELNLGSKFSDDVEKYRKRSETYLESPEAKKLQDYENIKQFLKDPRNRPLIEESLNSKEVKELYANYVDDIYKVAGLKDDVLGSLPNTAEQMSALFKKAASPDPNISALAKKKIDKLQKVIGDDKLNDIIEKLGVKEAFDKSFTHGSANANTWGAAGAWIAGVLQKVPVAGAVLGAVFGRFVDKYGPAMAKHILDRYATLAAAERMGIDVAGKMAQGIADFLGAPSISEGIRRKALPIMSTEDKDQPKSKKKISKLDVSEYNALKDKLSIVAADPNMVIDNASGSLGQAAEHMPNVSNQFASKAAMAAQFLYSKMPKDPLAEYNQMLGTKGTYRPSDAELSKFARYFEAVNDPSHVFDELAKGTITREHVEALKTVYPKIYQSVTASLMDNLAELRQELPYSKKLQLSVLFDLPVDYSTRPEFISAMQSLHSPENQAALSQAVGQPKFAPARIGGSEGGLNKFSSPTDLTLLRA
jgi:hypothetical protein